MSNHANQDFAPLNIAVLTISDTRELSTDTSGQALVDGLEASGHKLAAREIVKDDKYKIRAIVAEWVASDDIQVILLTGGTGFTGRDTTPQAIIPLFDDEIPGFGELFRAISYQQIGSSTIQSRAIAGFSNGVVIFALPGSTNACKTAWEGIIKEQLDSTHRPCNFVANLKQTQTAHCESRG